MIFHQVKLKQSLQLNLYERKIRIKNSFSNLIYLL